ncbi:MAG: 1,2-phenylacetyl-CoA epoxidase subunit PaaD [Geminicoccaceae bacterium]
MKKSTMSPRDCDRARAVAAAVLDPEVPCVTVADLGILRSVEMEGDVAVARVTPTYAGCPAVLAIELAIETALLEAGFKPRIERVLSPAWSTSWITEEGREKLRAFGIAPPNQVGEASAFFEEAMVTCPRCGSEKTEKIAAFGSTPCKAQYRCLACAEPFDYFKCL